MQARLASYYVVIYFTNKLPSHLSKAVFMTLMCNAFSERSLEDKSDCKAALSTNY